MNDISVETQGRKLLFPEITITVTRSRHMTFAFPWVLLLLPLTLAALRKAASCGNHRIGIGSVAGRAAVGPTPLASPRWSAPRGRSRTVDYGLRRTAVRAADWRGNPAGHRHRIAHRSYRAAWTRALRRERESRPLSRLEGAKRVVEQFIRHRPDDLIGVITFARYADTLSPLTMGHDALVEIVRGPGHPGTSQRGRHRLRRRAGVGLRPARSIGPGAGPLAEAAAADPVPVPRSAARSSCCSPMARTTAACICRRKPPGLAKKWGVRVYAISMMDERDGQSQLQNRRTTTTG